MAESIATNRRHTATEPIRCSGTRRGAFASGLRLSAMLVFRSNLVVVVVGAAIIVCATTFAGLALSQDKNSNGGGSNGGGSSGNDTSIGGDGLPGDQSYETQLKNLDDPAPPESVRLTLADGSAMVGEINGFGVDGVQLAGLPAMVRFSELIRLEAVNPAAPPSLQPLVILSNGDSLSGEIVSLRDDAIMMRWTRFENWPLLSLPLEVVRGVVVAPGADRRLLAEERVAIARYTERSDLLRFLNGDSLSGEIDSIDDTVVRMTTPAGERQINRAELRSITFNPDLLSEPPPPATQLHLLALTDGSQLHVELPRWLPERAIRCRLITGAEISLSTASIVVWRPIGGRAVYLSELMPQRSSFVPYGALDWSWQADRNVLSQPLTLSGVEYPRGIGMHSQSEIEYTLAGQYGTFLATVGIDDAAARQGIAAVSVLLDEKTVWSETVSAVAGPVAMKVQIPTATGSLTLKVDYGPNGDIGDHVDFVDAVLIRSASATGTTAGATPVKSGGTTGRGTGGNAAGKASPGKTPTGKALPEKVPTGKVQSGKAPAGNTPNGKAPTVKPPTGKS